MKLIVDVPEELTKKDHFYTEKEKWSIVDAVQNSVPLDDIFDYITTTIEKYKDIRYLKIGFIQNMRIC